MRAGPAGLISAAQMRRAFMMMLGAAAVLGIPLVVRGGVPILAVGVVSMLCAWAYAGGPKPLASLGLGDLFVFIFFGVVPVAGTVWLQRLEISADTLLASVPIALLAVAILVVNNLRDIPTDAAAGKRTMAVRLGDGMTRIQYTLCVAAAMLWPLLLASRLGAGALLVLLALPLAIRTVTEVRARHGAELNASLAATARLQLVYGVLLALGLTSAALMR
jgi:1,4-dihydroxy-2-naphthoate octaprenyltransferase